MAADDGYWYVAPMNANMEMLEAALFLAKNKAIHYVVLIDYDAARFDERHITEMAVDIDRRYRTVS